ncbi:family 43 glycosylhydrolase [Streptomyces cylindrosporus]|uniref:Family 43 glycosylhydrolase n=1 Tax=Streptomyces cylindrosporus TaxID=2927583 RepID=A0ABS9YP37_9ACTN|nr:family 43 glycosylhydrolase [Streptomyces cylindrosporus]MCI3278366.1 family 43 glycosylhydrolase [Streptomyces cylindrosporus]
MQTFRHGRVPWPALLAALVALLIPAVLAPPAHAADGQPYTNPVKSRAGADPWLTYYDGSYYLITTSITNEMFMRKSPTLAGLSTAPNVLIWHDDTAGRNANIWAPEIHFLDGRWYLYYAAGDSSSCCDGQRTNVLESSGTDPMGPYTWKSQIVGSNLDKGGWLIDTDVLEYGGNRYLLGSAFVGGVQSLVIAPLSNPYTLASTAFTVISTPTYSWEKVGTAVNEGPEVLQHDGRTFVTYSASHCGTPDYKLGQLELTGSDPLDPASWTKKSTPVFTRNDAAGVYGPGHNGFFTSPDGTENWIVYHANSTTTGGCGNTRSTRAQKFTWNADGTPNFGTPVALGTSLPGPSGETAATPTAYELVNRHSGKCLDEFAGDPADGADVIQYTCKGTANQLWTFSDPGDETNRVTNAATGKVLDVSNCGTADGTNIQQWSWLDNKCQRWQLVYTLTDYVRLVNVNSGKVADVANCNTADGTDVRQWTWLNNDCQLWKLKPVS